MPGAGSADLSIDTISPLSTPAIVSPDAEAAIARICFARSALASKESRSFQ
ncbi:MAG TPA: hypothetical protein VNG93_09555 [Candidatus Dormibacteraeota bacterium]|nr:hypothetical protein [Candidatus Dormibacteraeota bacterium]